MVSQFVGFVLFCFALVACGSPLQRYSCKGGNSATTQWHTVEASSRDGALDQGFGQCNAINEEYVSEEYAASGPPVWTCVSIVGYYLDASAMLRGDVEVFRAHSTAGTKQQALIAATIAMSRDVNEFAETNSKRVDELIPEPKTFWKRSGERRDNALYHRCWYRDHVPSDAEHLPNATWPRPKPMPLGPITGKPFLKWDPTATTPTVISDKQWTCRGAIYYRLRDENDLSPVEEFVLERNDLTGPDTAAESELRALLIAHAAVRASQLFGNAESFVLDTHQGSLDATPIRCWQKAKPPASVDWRGPTPW